MAALLERFYEVQGGSVELDGHDIRSLDPTWMRESVIGFIHQVGKHHDCTFVTE